MFFCGYSRYGIGDDSALPALVSNGSVGIKVGVSNGPVYYANDFIATDVSDNIEAIQF